MHTPVCIYSERESGRGGMSLTKNTTQKSIWKGSFQGGSWKFFWRRKMWRFHNWHHLVSLDNSPHIFLFGIIYMFLINSMQSIFFLSTSCQMTSQLQAGWLVFECEAWNNQNGGSVILLCHIDRSNWFFPSPLKINRIGISTPGLLTCNYLIMWSFGQLIPFGVCSFFFPSRHDKTSSPTSKFLVCTYVCMNEEKLNCMYTCSWSFGMCVCYLHLQQGSGAPGLTSYRLSLTFRGLGTCSDWPWEQGFQSPVLGALPGPGPPPFTLARSSHLKAIEWRF